MKLTFSFELSKAEMETLNSGMLDHALLLREPLDILCPGQTNKLLKDIPKFFSQDFNGENRNFAHGWQSILRFIVTQKYKITYALQVDEEMLLKSITAVSNVTTDMLPILKLYAQLVHTLREFDYSESTKKSFKALGDCLKLK